MGEDTFRNVKTMKDDELFAEYRRRTLNRRLNGAQKERVQAIACELRRRNYTNEEIASLGLKAAATVKQYTQGTQVEVTTTREEVLQTLSDMVKKGLTSVDAGRVADINAKCDERKLDFNKVISAAMALVDSDVDVQKHSEILARLDSYALSPSDMPPSLLAFAAKLKPEGLTDEEVKDFFQKLLDLASKRGSVRGVIATVDAEVTIEEKNAAARRLQGELDKRQEAIEAADKRVARLEERATKAQLTLNAHDELKSKGFSDEFYLKVQDVASKSGSSPDVLIEQLALPSRIKEMDRKKNELEGKISDMQSQLMKLETENSHRLRAINMCDELLYKFNLNEHDIKIVRDTAAKYGDPEEILSAVEKYGPVERLNKEKTGLQEQVRHLREEVDKMTGKLQAAETPLFNLLEQLPEKLRQKVDGAVAPASEALQKHVKEIVAENEKYLKTMSNAASLKDQLELAELLMLIDTDLEAASKIRAQLGVILLRLAIKFFQAKKLDFKPTTGTEFATKYFSNAYLPSKIPGLDYLVWLEREFDAAATKADLQKENNDNA